MSPRRPEPEPPPWPEGHAFTGALTLRMRWNGERWQVSDPAVGDREPTMCTHGLHLNDPPDIRNRCEAVRAELDLEPMPSVLALARQLAALEGLILAQEGTTHAQA